jgi:hypothetical protein
MAAIIGGAVGGAILLSAIVVFRWWCIARARRRERIEYLLSKEPSHPHAVPISQSNSWSTYPASLAIMTSPSPGFPVTYITPTPAHTAASLPPSNPLSTPRSSQHLVQKPVNFDSNASIIFSGAPTAPSIDTSVINRPSLWLDYIANACLRLVEEGASLTGQTVSNNRQGLSAPPVYDFKAT